MQSSSIPPGSQQQIQVLHVDDDPSVMDLTGTFLERKDDRLSVETAASATEGLKSIDDPDRSQSPDCIVSDYDMPGMDGIEFLRAVRERDPDLPFILFTGKGSEEVASDAISAGVTDYLQKRPGTEQYELLANRIQNAVQAQRMKQRADRADELMRLTEFTGDTGGFEIDVDTGEVLMTDGCRRLAGLADDATLSLEEMIELYHPDDRPEVRQTIDRATETDEQVRGSWRFQALDGTERIVDVTLTPATQSTNSTNTATGTVRSETHIETDITILRGAIHDVTDRQERKRELRTEREFIEQSINALDDLLYVLGTDGSLQRWNDQVPNITGYPDAELTNMQALELFPHDEHQTINNAIQMTLSGQPVVVEADLLTADGERLPYEFTGTRLTDADENVTGVVGIGRDLTDRKEIEADIDWYQTIMENLDQGVYVLDADCEFQFVNYRIQDIKGISEQNWNGRHLSSLAEMGILSTDEVERVQQKVDCLIAEETDQTSIEVEPALPKSTGVCELKLTSLDLQTRTHSDEELILVTTRDITEHKQREQNIRRVKRQYETLLENFPGGAVYLFNKDLEYVRARGTELSRVGLSPGDVEGKTPYDLFPEDIADELCNHLKQALTGVATTLEQEYGGERYRTQTVPIQTDGEEITQLMAVTQNITEESENRRKIRQKNEQLEEFASIVSHDLRNPLNVAEGHLELAVTHTQDARNGDADVSHDDDDDDDSNYHILKAKRAIKRCQRLIDDLLTLAREGDRVDDIEPIRFDGIIEECWETVETAAATLTIEDQHTPTHPRTLEADRSRLKQLLENLYRNAIEHGGKELTVSAGITDDGFYIADTGSGIPISESEKIFKTGYSTAEKGTGFGLRIVKQVADAHGWEIDVTNTTEQGGARFEFIGVQFTD